MYGDIFESNGQELIRSRLERLKEALRFLDISTRQELQAEVVSQLNRILALGTSVTPLIPTPAEAPAIAGHVSGNLQILNDDAVDIVKQLLGFEQESARLFNLSASNFLVESLLGPQVYLEALQILSLPGPSIGAFWNFLRAKPSFSLPDHFIF